MSSYPGVDVSFQNGSTGIPGSIGFAFRAMSSPCEIRLDVPYQQSPKYLTSAARDAILEVRRIESAYSRYQPDSIISKINLTSRKKTLIEVDSETSYLLNFADQIFSLSDGLFDITSGVLRQAWDFKNKTLPAPEALAAIMPLIGWPNVIRKGSHVGLGLPGMEIDFGGFGKEYAADRAAGVLFERGLRHGFVNLGGDIRVLGPKSDGAPWRFAIQHPRNEGEIIASVDLSSGALATSGDYERGFEQNGQRYHHILDPSSGWPAQYWSSVSVIAPACVAAGALSTIAFLKCGQALEFLNAQQASALLFDLNLGPSLSMHASADGFQLNASDRNVDGK